MADSRSRRTAGGVSSLGLHLVWCPKCRHRLLSGRADDRVNQLLDEIASENGWEVVAREVMPDHLHIFVRARTTNAPAEVVRRFKGRTSRMLRQEFARLGRRRALWSRAHFAASVGYMSEKTVRQYIEHQWDQAA